MDKDFKDKLYESLYSSVSDILDNINEAEEYDENDYIDLTYENLSDYIQSDECWFPGIDTDDYDEYSVLKFWSDVESVYPMWKERLLDVLLVSEEELDSFLRTDKSANMYMSGEEWLMSEYFDRFVRDAMNKWPDAYEWQEPDYRCTVCGKPIEYDSNDSVMLYEPQWKQVLDFYGLTEYEKEAAIKSYEFSKMCNKYGGLRLNPPQNTHTFVCNDCIEKALGHEIREEDINDSLFNQNYRRTHNMKTN